MKLSNLFKGDLVIWAIFFFLCIISLVEVFSAASTLAYKNGSFWDPLIKQAIFLGAGTLIAIVVHNIPCRYFKVIPVTLLVPCALLLLFTLFFGTRLNEGSRWINIFGIQFQPSEIAKGVVVVTVALILAQMQREDGADPKAFKYILLITGGICGLIFTENLSTALILFGVVYLMMFIGRIPLLLMGKLTGVLLVVLMLFGAAVFLPASDSKFYDLPGTGRFHTWKSRLQDKMNEKVTNPEDYDIAAHAQEGHAHIAIATSGGIGKMPGNSVQRDFLAQAYSDFIFAIIIEEMGLWGAVFVVFLYIVLLVRAGRVASRCERNFPAFLVMGLALLLVAQALLNMMVATGLFPVTGQPLPLISRGGTSTLITCTYIGMILSVSRYARKSKIHSDPFAKGAKELEESEV